MNLKITAILLALTIMLSGCSGNNVVNGSVTEQPMSTGVIATNFVADGISNVDTKNELACRVPQELTAIPKEYFSAATSQGTLVELFYDTYESKTYEQKAQQLQKRAIVYLPYGYSKEQKYNVFYL